MKKTSKPFIALSLLVFIVLTSLVLAYVGIKLECEMLVKEKVLAEEKLVAKKNWRVNLFARYQYLSAKERIVEIAKQELGMIENRDSDTMIIVSKDKIKKISGMLEQPHE
jgi:cell division protein FtsL